MARASYQTKQFINEIITHVVTEENVDSDLAVVVSGRFGERGVMFYPYVSVADPDAKCGFSILGRGANPSHTNMCRDDAVELVQLLIEQYDMDVNIVRTIEVTVD